MADEEDDWGGTYGVVSRVGGSVVEWTCSLGVDVLADGYAWGFGCDAGGDEVVGEGTEVAAGHVDDKGGVFGEGSGPLGGDLELACGVVGCGEDEF